MKDSDFLKCLAIRLVDVYNENPNLDIIHRLNKIADKLENEENKDLD